MRILFVASEAVPFCKTGGLADVSGSLSKVLFQRGHDVRLVLPRYQAIEQQKKYRPSPILPELNVHFGDYVHRGAVLRMDYSADTPMPVYLIDERDLFGRPGLYGNGSADYIDNDRRFAFFCMASLWLLKGLDWQPDIIHLHDWQTGLVAALLRHHPVVSQDPFFQEIRSVFSIHNLAYQGNFDKYLIPSIGLPWDVFTQEGLEFFGKASFLKSGLVYSDELVAVSPTYAKEIQVDEQGAGMAGALRSRADSLHGILNGIDVDIWNPAADPGIPAAFDVAKPAGKAECKAALQRELGLPVEPRKPLIGMISRLVAAKGFDLITRSLEELLNLDAQFVVLGTGEAGYEQILQKAAAEVDPKRPGRIAVRIGYDEAMSHRIIAGSDMFLMPSVFEPCGLTQLYSMRYGTLPIVRRTGGLADSVTAINEASIKNGTGTGFLFDDYRPEALLRIVRDAIHLYARFPDKWTQVMRNAMTRDFSWANSAAEYEKLYEKARSARGA